MHQAHLRKGGQCQCQWSHYSKLSILTPMLAQVYDSSQFHCDRRKLPTPLPSFLAITVESCEINDWQGNGVVQCLKS